MSFIRDIFYEGIFVGIKLLLILIVVSIWYLFVRIPLSYLGIWPLEPVNDEVPFP